MPIPRAQSIPATAQEPFDSNMPDPAPQRKDHTAQQHDPAKPDYAEPIVKRLHGRALPE
jgi:hypothetical protein